jgi:hypothetical protein
MAVAHRRQRRQPSRIAPDNASTGSCDLASAESRGFLMQSRIVYNPSFRTIGLRCSSGDGSAAKESPCCTVLVWLSASCPLAE